MTARYNDERKALGTAAQTAATAIMANIAPLHPKLDACASKLNAVAAKSRTAEDNEMEAELRQLRGLLEEVIDVGIQLGAFSYRLKPPST